MSVDIDWSAATGGHDSSELADAIRAFVHDKFQQVALPRFIRAVKVHGFDFGQVAPDIEIKDVCDPLDDFYEEEDEDEDEDGSLSAGSNSGLRLDQRSRSRQYGTNASTSLARQNSTLAGRRESSQPNTTAPTPIDVRRSSITTPGILGGTSNLNYFHLPLSARLPGATTPLAAVAAARFHGNGWWDDGCSAGPQRLATPDSNLTATPASLRSSTPPSAADPSSRPSSQDHQEGSGLHAGIKSNHYDESVTSSQGPRQRARFQERSSRDLQIVARVSYSGDVKMSLTAELLLDYPMESFVGIPLKLNITGLSFDGVAILAYIKRRAHFCFLSPEDAEVLIGATERQSGASEEYAASAAGATDQHRSPPRMQMGGLLQDIRVESEIGDRTTGKQVLKNVGKVERFVLDQVRRIFEDEFVYPSFWTFLV